MRFIYKFLFVVFLCVGIKSSKAQLLNPPKIIPASPEASAIAKYINYPVDYSTGLANVNIPLYEIKVGDITLPISLSYHASGYKVNESSGWVALGWSLQAEPSVSRSIQGRPDETGYLTNNLTGYSTYPNDGGSFYNSLLADGIQEEEPDEFYYKLLSKSGGFYFNRKPRSTDPHIRVTHTYDPIKIDYINDLTWEITDDNGVFYKFGTAHEYTETTQSYHYGITAWKAKEIVSPLTGDVISFIYHPYTEESIINLRDMVVVEDSINDPATPFRMECTGGTVSYFPIVKDFKGADGILYRVKNDGQFEWCGTSYSSVPTNTNRSVKIKEITFTNGKVVFEKNGLGNISFIKVYSGDKIIKQIKFYQSNFNLIGQGFLNRTRLDAVEIQDANGNVIGKYSFDYDPSALPPQISKSQDYWGYFNNISNDVNGLVPPIQVSATNHSASWPGQRTVNFEIGGGGRSSSDEMDAGILTRITYPTKGYTEFEYETNKYMNNGSLTRAGGLRIVKIRDYDPVANKKIVRLFRYGLNENGAGFIKRKITPDEFMSEQLNYYRLNNPSEFQPVIVYTTRNRVYSCNSLTDLFYSNGAPVVYDEVTEYQIDESNNQNLGKTVYTYANYDYSNGTPLKYPKTTLTFYPKDDWRRGQLLHQANYKNTNGTYDLISKVSYNYGEFNNGTIPTGRVYRNKNLIIEDNTPTNQYEDILYHAYTLHTGVRVLTSETILTKNGTQELTATKTYTYGNAINLLPTQIQATNSDGKTLITANKYPHDLTLSGTAETARLDLISKWRVNALLEQTQTKGSSALKTKTDYKIFNGRALPELVKTNTGTSSADEIRLRYGDYDSKSNVLYVSKEDDAKISYIWAYNQSYPIAEVKNALPEQIAYSSFENPSDLGGWTYTHDPSTETKTGILSFNGASISKSGLPSGNYILTFFGKRKNGTNGSVSGSISTSVNTDNWMYYSFSLNNVTSVSLNLSSVLIDELRLYPAGAQMTTYTYDPLIGVTSATDAGGISTYYDYDNVGRLSLVRDQNKTIVKRMTYHYKQ